MKSELNIFTNNRALFDNYAAVRAVRKSDGAVAVFMCPGQFSTSAAQVAAMSDEELVRRAWPILTNNRQCGGGSVKGRRLAQRRIRALGYRFFLGGWFDSEERNGGSCWGMLRPGDRPDSTLDWVEVGVSLDHCAHKLGAGNATAGWRIYWAS